MTDMTDTEKCQDCGVFIRWVQGPPPRRVAFVFQPDDAASSGPIHNEEYCLLHRQVLAQKESIQMTDTPKCPRCVAPFSRSRNKAASLGGRENVYECENYGDGTHETLDCLRRQLAAAQARIAELEAAIAAMLNAPTPGARRKAVLVLQDIVPATAKEPRPSGGKVA